MKNTNGSTFISPAHTKTKFFVSSAVLIGLLQVPVLPLAVYGQKVDTAPEAQSAAIVNGFRVLAARNSVVNEARVSAVTKSTTAARDEMALTFFGDKAKERATQATIDDKKTFVSTRKAFPASLGIIEKHEDTIRRKAREHGVPENVAIGIGLLENGGSETAKSPAGALGVFQLMPGTARNLGLAVSGKVDERRNPEKNINAGMKYLRMNFERFGDWGLSTWAYHAGEGNVSKALGIYAKANHGVTLPGIKNFPALRAYVEKHGITIDKLLSDPSVKRFVSKLKDDSIGYPYKVVATASLFEDAGHGTQVAER